MYSISSDQPCSGWAQYKQISFSTQQEFWVCGPARRQRRVGLLFDKLAIVIGLTVVMS